LRAAADIRRVRFFASLTALRAARRLVGRASSGKARSIATISALRRLSVGHASVVTTERYIHHTLAELSKAAAVLESGGVFDPTSEPKVGEPVPRMPDSTPDKRIH